MTDAIFKILAREEWAAAQARGVFAGSAVDLEDGYIHFSTADQVRETARRHFAGQPDLMLLAIEPNRLPDQALLIWEPSRGGALFPHLYGELPVTAVAREWPLPWDGAVHVFPAL